MNPVIKVSLTKEAYDLCSTLLSGDLVYVVDVGCYFCKRHDDKYDLLIEEELTPCLGTKCDKRDLCYKYNLSKKFSSDKVHIRDLSIESGIIYDEDDNNLGNHIYCNKENKYRLFRWDV